MTAALRCRTLLASALLLFSGTYPHAQNKNDNSQAQHKSQAIFRAPVNVVVVNATVTDRDGNPVTNLSSKDFQVYDDGKSQDIQTFALEYYGSAELDEAQAPANAVSAPKNTPGEKVPEHPAARPRMVSLVIDDLIVEIP